MYTKLLFKWLVLTSGVFVSTSSFAWSERGHDLIARAATRIAVARSGDNPSVQAIFAAKEHMLGHLANVPDIVWRSMGREIEALNDPTHFIDLDYLMIEPTVDDFPKTPAAATARLRELCGKKPLGYTCPNQKNLQVSTAGTAPWRLRQLFALAVKDLKAGQVDNMLVHAGVLAHFVGDLANPHHTTRDYDGYEQGQGGIHSYFESDIVSSYEFDLDQEVLTTALRQRPFDQLHAADDPLAIAIALAVNSYKQLHRLNDIDRRNAVSKASRQERGLNLPAERKDPRTVNRHFRQMVVERLALAADTLAQLWLGIWREAGSPNLATFRSYTYRVAPEFIIPDYLANDKT